MKVSKSLYFPGNTQSPLSSTQNDRLQKDLLRVYDSFVHTYPCPPTESYG